MTKVGRTDWLSDFSDLLILENSWGRLLFNYPLCHKIVIRKIILKQLSIFATPHLEKRRLHIALVGNPNSGKSSLFNCLTGLNQKVGNFPGVTVDKKTGYASLSRD